MAQISRWKKRRRKALQEERAAVIERRQRLHAEIDAWREKRLQAEAAEQAKTKERTESETATTTSKVETVERLRLYIERLITLRQLRRKKAQREGDLIPEEGDTFHEAVAAMEALPSSLTPSNQSTKPHQRPIAQLQPPKTSQEIELEHLIDRRRAWDMYIVPSDNPAGSPIPAGYVDACPPANRQWAMCISGHYQ
ncbi:hypothetical protein BZG36_01671 [Bifiguratus adelaidae]|uniref:Uncharacterized protein n=1 Tax=Bifiguratus adelaidae TaxID=1938954 RepID=A0A261Y4L8_9FUNG|nr:hypothetical protein BZG36_01671 [Bifiguratus adelaidae]